MYDDWFCPNCEYFQPNKVRKEPKGFLGYGCKQNGYIPQSVKDIKQIACGCGMFKKAEPIEQLSLF